MEPPELHVIFEDKQLLALNKTQGIVVEREAHLKFTLETLALDYIRSKERYPQKCFIGVPHRLGHDNVAGELVLRDHLCDANGRLLRRAPHQ